MPVFLRAAQYFGFVATEISNTLLLWLILTKASSRFGSYKYLMVSYSVYSLIYAFVEVCAQPIIHTRGASMFLYVDSFLRSYHWIAQPLSSVYCASFALCVSLLATHFVYRFLAVCRPNDLHHVEGPKLAKLFVVPALFCALWYFSVAVLYAPSDVKSEYMRENLEFYYHHDSFKVGYIAMLYYYYDKSGNLVIGWKDFIGTFLMCGIMQTCIVTMIICGWKTFRKMESVGSMSEKTRELNRQLFRTLILQTLVPFCTMFAPVGLLLILPMFSIEVGTYSNLTSLNAGLYPALDACIAIFMIRDFRDTVLCRQRKKKNAINTTSATNFDSSVLSG